MLYYLLVCVGHLKEAYLPLVTSAYVGMSPTTDSAIVTMCLIELKGAVSDVVTD